MQRRHGARLDAAAIAIAHDELITGAQLSDKGVQPAEVIAVIAVAHNHEFATCRANAAKQSAAISPLGDMNHPGAVCLGDRLRAVGAAVVGDDHLASAAAAGEEGACLGNAARQGFGFVETRHQDREFTRFTHPVIPRA